MNLQDLKKQIEKLNQSSDIKYHIWQYSRHGQSNHYNDRKVTVYFENNGKYASEKKYLKLIEFHEHKFGAIDSLSKYMGFDHKKIFKLLLKYVTQRRSERAPITNKYW